jgi:hypothetical protein
MHTEIASSQPASDAKPASTGTRIAVVVYGRDTKNKGHAASFAEADAELAARAAGLMEMALWHVDETGQSLALQLPKGKIFGSGRAFTPFVSGKLFAELEAVAGRAPTLKGANGSAPAEPRQARKARTKPAGESGEVPATTPAADPEKLADDSLTRPGDWGAIGPDCLVLATTGNTGEGWFEAAVVAQRDDDLFELRWVGWPDEPLIVRRRDSLALLPPRPVG